MRIAINGFGRIGRMVFRAGMNDSTIDFVGINDLGDPQTLAYLLKYDTVHGKFAGTVTSTDHSIVVNGKDIPVFAKKDPTELPWRDLRVDIVVESTGLFTHRDDILKHIKAGARKVLLSAPGKGDDPIKTVVIGVNEHEIDDDDLIISNASCTTNSIAPIVKIIHEAFGIVNGMVMTVHSYTGDQMLVDGPHKKDMRRGRAAAENIVPTATGAAVSVEKAYPPVVGKLTGLSLRVPTPAGSITDFTAIVEKSVSVEDVKNLFKNKCAHELKSIIEYTEDEIVSKDIVGNPHSGIIDGNLTQVRGNLIKIFSWYDNEWGYSVRMIDLLKRMG